VERGDVVKAIDLIAVIHPLPNPSDVNTAEGELHNARIGHLHAKQEFERVEAFATISGMVLERPVEIGTFVIETNTFNKGTAIVVIADTSDLTFRGKVDEPDPGSLRVGMPMSVTLGAFPGERFEGRLEFIAPKAVEKDGITTFEIRAGLALKADRFVRAGYSATADIVVAQRAEVLALPERYVHFQDGPPYVMIETAPGLFEQRTITLGLSDGITTGVISSLNEGCIWYGSCMKSCSPAFPASYSSGSWACCLSSPLSRVPWYMARSCVNSPSARFDATKRGAFNGWTYITSLGSSR
jgi:hypothetical protein